MNGQSARQYRTRGLVGFYHKMAKQTMLYLKEKHMYVYDNTGEQNTNIHSGNADFAGFGAGLIAKDKMVVYNILIQYSKRK